MTQPRLLVVSPPCHQPVNRAVYRELVERHGIAVNLVVPRRLFIGGMWRDTAVAGQAPYELNILDVAATHSRLQQLRGLGKVALAWQPTHVLVENDPATLMTWQAARACVGARLWVLTAENLAPRDFRAALAGLKSLHPAHVVGPLVTRMLRAMVRPRIDRVFTLSRDGTRVMEAAGFAGRTTQIPLGFDPALFRIQPRERIAAMRSQLGLVKPTVAYFGRLTPEKGVHLLIDALSAITDAPWQLLIDNFSDYPTAYAARLAARIESLGIGQNVVHFDASHDEMPDFMNAADIVVLPSLSMPNWKEQYGRVLPEAMACGKLVVGSDCGAIPELVAGYGRIVPEGNIAALTAELRRLLEMEGGERRVVGEAASAYAHENLSITRQAEIWSALLKDQADSA